MSFFNQQPPEPPAPSVVPAQEDPAKYDALKSAVGAALVAAGVPVDTPIDDNFVFDLAVYLRAGNLPAGVEHDSFDGNDLRQIMQELWTPQGV